MTVPLLLTSGLTPLQLAVREHFQRGGSVATIAIGIIAAVLVLIALYQLMKRRRADAVDVRIDDPQRLFKDLLHTLDLPLQERRLLIRLARDLRLTNPSVLLLSAELFDGYVRQWRAGREHDRRDDACGADRVAAAVRRTLFV